MNSVTFVRGRGVTSMAIVGSVDDVLSHLVNTCEGFDKLVTGLTIEGRDELVLDPGGMYNRNTPHAKFEIDGIKFDIQHTKIGWSLNELEKGKERIPGYKRSTLWMSFVILPIDLHTKLCNKLKELVVSNEEMHAQITEFELLEKLEKNTNFFSNRIPRETGRFDNNNNNNNNNNNDGDL